MIEIDEMPKADQHVQQLDILVRYFPKTQQKVVVEHLESSTSVVQQQVS